MYDDPTKGTSNSQIISAYDPDNPDFNPEKDCPQARGAAYNYDIMSNDNKSVEENK